MNKFCGWLLIGLSFFAAGCSFLTPPKEKPMLQDTMNNRIRTLATTPERRVVLADLGKEHICAEPSADVAESLTSSLRALAAASVEKPANNDSARLSGEVAKQFATSLNVLFSRSQGVQLFRDGSYALCQASMNGDIKRNDFIERFDNLLNASAKLIELELPAISERQAHQLLFTAQTSVAESKKAAAEAQAAAELAARSVEAASKSAEAARTAAESVKQK